MGCYTIKMSDGGTAIMCGDLGAHCADCSGFGDFLCDYPVGDGKTCDRPMCEDHASEIAPEVHYCVGHMKLWEEFRDAGGVKRELENIIAFKPGRPPPCQCEPGDCKAMTKMQCKREGK